MTGPPDPFVAVARRAGDPDRQLTRIAAAEQRVEGRRLADVETLDEAVAAQRLGVVRQRAIAAILRWATRRNYKAALAEACERWPHERDLLQNPATAPGALWALTRQDLRASAEGRRHGKKGGRPRAPVPDGAALRGMLEAAQRRAPHRSMSGLIGDLARKYGVAAATIRARLKPD